MLKKLIPFLLVCLLIVPYNVHAEVIGPSGSCGENLTWTLQLDGTLTISGTGAMTDFGPSYAENVSVPWAGNRADIKTVVIEEGVTSIGNNAFVACSNLTQVTMPNSLTRIGEHSFQNCFNLTQADIPASVTEIGEYAFGGCKSLTSVLIPESVTQIADYTFESCVGLIDVVIPEGVTSIGHNAFKYCPALTEIVIPKTVTFIGRHAFDECENLGHILYTGTQEQWASVTVRSGAIADHMAITYHYTDGMDYHVFQNECTAKCTHCSFTRDADHNWDDGITAGNALTFTCTVCGETRVDGAPEDPVIPTQPIEPTAPSEPTIPDANPSVPLTTAPAGNDPSQITPKPDVNGVLITVIAVAVIAALCAALIVIKKRK